MAYDDRMTMDSEQLHEYNRDPDSGGERMPASHKPDFGWSPASVSSMPEAPIGWCANTMIRWSDCTASIGLPIAAEPWEGCIGFLPIYATREGAEKRHPGVPLQTVRKPL